MDNLEYSFKNVDLLLNPKCKICGKIVETNNATELKSYLLDGENVKRIYANFTISLYFKHQQEFNRKFKKYENRNQY